MKPALLVGVGALGFALATAPAARSAETNPPTVNLPTVQANPPTINAPTAPVKPPTVNVPTVEVSPTPPPVNPPTINVPTVQGSPAPPTANAPTVQTNPPTISAPTIYANPPPAPPTVNTPTVQMNPPTSPTVSAPAVPVNPAQDIYAELPAGCVPKVKQYLADVNDSGGDAKQYPGHAADATSSYQALDASPECRDAIKRIADANTLDLPARHLKPLTRNAFSAAMTADPASLMPRQPAAGAVVLQDDGYDPQEVLAFGFALLNLASGAANLANALHGGGAAVGAIGGAVRGLAPATGSNCFLQNANNIKVCVQAPQSDITGTRR